MAVTPGANPASSGLAVTANLTAIGGALSQPFFDDGTNGDTAAGDGTFSFNATANSGSGAVSLPAAITDAQGRSASATIALTVGAAGGVTFIHTIQGQTDTPLTGAFKIEGIVTAIYPQLSGFYVQEEDADADADALTSEGIFVFQNAAVQVGQKVQVQGTVGNDFGLTQFAAGASVTVQSGGALFPLPTVAVPAFPTPAAVGGVAYFERFEGMRVLFPGTLFVTDNFDLGQFGEAVLSPASHLFIPTNTIDPNDAPASGTASSGTGNVAAVTAQSAANARSRIILDDDRDGSNPPTLPYLYASPLGGKTLRLGDSTSDLTGILSYGFSEYRIRPVGTVTFSPTNPRTAAPEPVGGNVKVATQNVLNYFITFGGADDRGADNTNELNRQRAKLVASLSAINADIVGLVEIQNNGSGSTSALFDLLNHDEAGTANDGLNPRLVAAGQTPYTILAPPSDPFGTDAIKVALIYKAARVTPSGPALTDNVNAAAYNRPPLAQLFTVSSTVARFTSA